MAEKHPWVYISLVLTMIMWSLTFVWFKIVNEVLGPFTIVFLRLLVSSIILLIISWILGLLQRIRPRDFIRFFMLSLVYPVIYFIAESIGLTLIQASLAAVIIATIPLIIPVGAYILYRERLSGLAEGAEPGGSIVLLRVHGTLSHGRPTDLDVPAIKALLEERGAEAVFVNRRGLRKAQAVVPGGGDDLAGLDREEVEGRTLRQALEGSEAPVAWLREEEGLDLARELLRIAKEDRGDLSEAKHTEAVKARCLEVLALHERPGPDTGGGEGG